MEINSPASALCDMGVTSKSRIVPKVKHGSPRTAPLVIAITGTPGVGKTKLARKLSLLLREVYIDLNKLALKSGLARGKDPQRQALVIDEKGLYSAIQPFLKAKKRVIADSHLAHFLPKKAVFCCVVVHCSLPVLRRRLKARGYSPAKVKENLEAELFGIIQSEAEKLGHRILLVDASTPLTARDMQRLKIALVRT